MKSYELARLRGDYIMIKTTFNARLRDMTGDKLSVTEEWIRYKFDLPFGCIGFVRFDGYSWNITEHSTGLSVGKSYNTRKEAIEETTRIFNEIGRENVLKAIERQKEYYNIL